MYYNLKHKVFKLLFERIKTNFFLKKLYINIYKNQFIPFSHANISSSEQVLKEREREMDFRQLREAIEEVKLVDGHAHNIVALDSTFPFIRYFSEAEADALSCAPHSLSFKVP